MLTAALIHLLFLIRHWFVIKSHAEGIMLVSRAGIQRFKRLGDL